MSKLFSNLLSPRWRCDDLAHGGCTGLRRFDRYRVPEMFYNLVKGWSEGFLGRTLAIAAFLVGAIVGFAKSTAMPALVGIVFAVLFAVGPGIIDGIASALI